MIVITGAMGHIGSKLIRVLDDVVMIDNFCTQRYTSLFALGKHKLIESDIMEMDLEQAFKGAEVVIHLAGIVDAANSFDNKNEVYRVNYEGTKRVAEACAKVNVPMIFASTTSIYGVQDSIVDETCTELKPQSPYAFSKMYSEEWLRLMPGLRFIILRMGTIFGISPGMRFHTAINKFCWQAAMDQPITVWRTALHQKRPYLDLYDMVEAIKFIIENRVYDDETYNLVTVNTTVQDVIDIIASFKPDLSIKYVDSKIMNQLSYNVSSKKFESLGFRFSGGMYNGIKETMELLCLPSA